jgi:hypothetical protein
MPPNTAPWNVIGELSPNFDILSHTILSDDAIVSVAVTSTGIDDGLISPEPWKKVSAKLQLR